MHTQSPISSVTPEPRTSCDGRCQQQCKKRKPRCLVIAASEGMIAIFQKESGGLTPCAPVPQGSVTYASLQDFSDAIQEACDLHTLDQLIIVGSQNDMAWLRASLPPMAQGKLVAEIPHPLLPEWLQETALQQLATTLTPLIL